MYEKFKDFQLAILGVCLAIGLIFAALISTTNLSKDSISVTGSAYEIVKSDSANWTFLLKSKESTKLQAYKKIQEQLPKLETGEENAQVFLTKVDGDVQTTNFISSLKKIK